MSGTDPLVLYATNTRLAYIIAQRYYNQKHYVWCTPYFDPSSVPALDYTVPPSSSPAEIYRSLRKDVDHNERHSDKIKANKAGIIRGAQEKFDQGEIDENERKEIAEIVEAAEVADFSPLIFVIPFSLVKGKLSTVPVDQRAHPLSSEFIIQTLPRDYFDVLRLEG
jgi:hypothetical protein